jgi:pyruvate-ferredoxin/flavodoxin oxidoreductase
VVRDTLQGEFEEQLRSLRDDYEVRLADLKARYPGFIARRLAEGFLRSANGDGSLSEFLGSVPAVDLQLAPLELPIQAPVPPVAVSDPALGSGAAPATAVLQEAPPDEPEEDELLALEPYIDTAMCTSCNECTDLNGRMFAYDENKQAYIQDASAGTFAELVQAAERCTARIVHPGTPLNPAEKNLEKWIVRAEPFS